VLDAMSELLMEGLDVASALEWMRRNGFELAGLDMRVMGLEEMIDELREKIDDLYERYRMDEATESMRQRLDEVLDREQRARRESSGFESARMNDFLERRHAPSKSLADAVEKFRDFEFEDADAGRDFDELLEEVDRLRALEDFLRRRGERFSGDEVADYETAQSVREQIEAMEKLARDLAEGRFQSVSADEPREMLGDSAGDSLILIH
jgi:phage shock protein A